LSTENPPRPKSRPSASLKHPARAALRGKQRVIPGKQRGHAWRLTGSRAPFAGSAGPGQPGVRLKNNQKTAVIEIATGLLDFG